MAVIRWKPWSLSQFLDDDFDVPTLPMLNRLGQGLNIYETEQAVVAEAALPGIPEDKIDVSVENNIVRVSASQNEQTEEKDQRRYFMTTLSSSYNYSFRLPEGVSQDKEPTAELADGVLVLTFPKVEQKPPKKINIKKTGGKTVKSAENTEE